MATNIVVPQMGESVLEGTIVEWKVKVGDTVAKDQPLVELATDKVNIEIPSEVAGKVGQLLAEPGETVRVGATVAVILGEGESAGASAKSASPDSKPAEATASAATQQKAAAASSGPIGFGSGAATTTTAAASPAHSGSGPSSNGRKATGAKGSGKMAPKIRKLVREYGVNPDELTPTGPAGRLTQDDIMDFVNNRSTVSSASSAQSAPSSAPTAAPKPSAPTQQIPTRTVVQLEPGEREKRVPLTGPRKAVAEHMVRSKATSAHVTTFEDCDFTELHNFREKHKAEFKEKYGVNVTFLPFIMKAVTVGLKEYPLINASMTETEVVYKNYYNIGVAVGRDAGLIVPVVHNADQKSVIQLAQEISTLSSNAHNNRLNPKDMSDGTFTLTNAGGFGATGSTPIISQPQVCILGVHNIRKMPWVVETEMGDEIQIRHIMNFGLSFDHRLIDGHIAVQFLHRVIQLLQEPAHLLVFA